MAHINLLPWREELRQERQKQFLAMLIAGFIFAAVILFGIILFADSLLDEQKSRNSFLQKEIAVLDLKIREISTLAEAREKLVARMQVIEQLQLSRPKVVKVFDSLVRTMPEGIHLDKVSRQASMLTLSGVAQSNARVSVLMRKIDANQEFEESGLKIIQKTSTKDDAIRKFTLEVRESKIKEEEDNI